MKEQKAKGLIKHWGFSFHADPELLEELLDEAPGRGVRAAADQLRRLGEPGRGLPAQLGDLQGPRQARHGDGAGEGRHPGRPDPHGQGDLLEGAEQRLSYAGWAIRYAASLDNILTVLSGMSNLAQMEDNLSYMKDFKPLDEAEQAVIARAQEALNADQSIPCTACHYCVEGCPMGIPIPEIFTVANRRKGSPHFRTVREYTIVTQDKGKASDCIQCGQCEGACPQHLPIISLLEKCRGGKPSLPAPFRPDTHGWGRSSRSAPG